MKIKNNLSRLLIVFFVAAMVIFVACKKEMSASDSADQKSFADLSSIANIEASQAFDDVYNNVMGVNSNVAIGGTGVFARIITVDSFANTCFTVIVTRLNAPAPFPVEIVIDFGAGCIGKDGVTRKGKLTTVYSGPLTQAGNTSLTTFDNFFISGTKLDGSQLIENISTPQQCVFKVTIKDGKLTKTDGSYSIWNSINTITQIVGSSTPNIAKDDVLSIAGQADGTLKNDSVFLKWNSKIEEPLIKKFTCRWLVKGKMGILGTNAVAALIDFGDGDCDNKANLIINGSTTEITLH